MTRLKICGLLPGDDLSFTASPAVAHVGFVLVPQSRRYVAPDAVREMTRQVHPSCQAVGVFVNESLDNVQDAANVAGITHIQLHGDESPAFCAQLRDTGFTVWKAIQVSSELVDEVALLACICQYAPSVDAILFDTAPPQDTHAAISGGHGKVFDWRVLPRVNQRASQLLTLPPVWVAGGMQAAHVPALYKHFIPFGIDVSSGVEEASRKSLTRIQQMIEAVNSHAE
jgi:phosphoribosylanthranilate isomerase